MRLRPAAPDRDEGALQVRRISAFPPGVITVAVRWYLRSGRSHRDVEELLAERGVELDHVTAYRVGAAVHPAVPRLRPALPSAAVETARRRLGCPVAGRQGRLAPSAGNAFGARGRHAGR